MPLTVTEHDGDAAAWNSFVRGQPGWTHFHLWEWKHVMEDVFRHRCSYLADLLERFPRL